LDSLTRQPSPLSHQNPIHALPTLFAQPEKHFNGRRLHPALNLRQVPLRDPKEGRKIILAFRAAQLANPPTYC
jgi:hypothetical protein